MDNRGMNTPTNPYVGHRYPPEIIAHAVWLYHRVPQKHTRKGRRRRPCICVEAVGKMTGGPSKSAVRSGLQTTPSGCHQEWRS